MLYILSGIKRSENQWVYRIVDSVKKLLIQKRIDFIASELQKATEACRQATREGRKYHFSSDSIELS